MNYDAEWYNAALPPHGEREPPQPMEPVGRVSPAEWQGDRRTGAARGSVAAPGRAANAGGECTDEWLPSAGSGRRGVATELTGSRRRAPGCHLETPVRRLGHHGTSVELTRANDDLRSSIDRRHGSANDPAFTPPGTEAALVAGEWPRHVASRRGSSWSVFSLGRNYSIPPERPTSQQRRPTQASRPLEDRASSLGPPAVDRRRRPYGPCPVHPAATMSITIAIRSDAVYDRMPRGGPRVSRETPGRTGRAACAGAISAVMRNQNVRRYPHRSAPWSRRSATVAGGSSVRPVGSANAGSCRIGAPPRMVTSVVSAPVRSPCR